MSSIIRLFKGWQFEGAFDLAFAHEFQKVFRGKFPNHRSAFLSGHLNGEVTMLVHPALDLTQFEIWDRVYEAKCRELGLGQPRRGTRHRPAPSGRSYCHVVGANCGPLGTRQA